MLRAVWASWYINRGRDLDHPPADSLPQRAPARPQPGPRWSCRLCRTRRWRAHQLALSNMRCCLVRAAVEHALHGTGRTCGGADLERPRTGRRARCGSGRTPLLSVEVVQAWGQPPPEQPRPATRGRSRGGVPIKTYSSGLGSSGLGSSGLGRNIPTIACCASSIAFFWAVHCRSTRSVNAFRWCSICSLIALR